MAPGRLSRRLVVIGAGLLALAPPALAHRALSVLTLVEWSEPDKAVQVTHRIHGHDAEVGLAAVGAAPATALDITQARTQAMAALYIEERFKITVGGKPLALAMVGAEMDGDFLVVYQEAKMSAPPAELSITDGILRDVFDTQANLVNVRMGKRTRSLLFAGGDGTKVAKDLL